VEKEQAAKLRHAFFNVVRTASARRLVEMLQVMHTKRLRLGFGYLEHNMLADEWKMRQKHVLEKSQRGHAHLHHDTTKEMAELRRAWRAQREALLGTWGDANRKGVEPPPEEVQQLRRLDAGFRAKLDALYQGQQESTIHFDSTCKKLTTECNATLQALAFPPCVDASIPVDRRSLQWTVDKPEMVELQWAHASRKPDIFRLPFVVAADLEEQRHVLQPSLEDMLGQLDALPDAALKTSASLGQRSRQSREAQPYQGAQLLKSVLWRSQRRLLRPVFHRPSSGPLNGLHRSLLNRASASFAPRSCLPAAPWVSSDPISQSPGFASQRISKLSASTCCSSAYGARGHRSCV